MTAPTVIGITGNPGSGKDTLAVMLQRHFEGRGLSATVVAPGDLVRAYVREHQLGDPGDRSVLNQAAQYVRETEGPNYWLRHSLEQSSGCDIELYPGMRHRSELELLRQHDGVLVAIDASRELRYQWVRRRNRPGDDISFEKFVAQEEAERNSPTHQVDALMKAADVHVQNDGTLKQLDQLGAEIASHFPDHLAARYNVVKE